MKRTITIVAAAALVVLALPGLAAAASTLAVVGRDIPGQGTLVVAASNQMTVYTFDKDVAGSGVSNCSGQCLVNWPALTVAAGDTPTGGPGVTGTLGTIVRTDNSTTQVTYNGLPLYFFIKDAAPGDAKGIYPGWRAIVLVAAAPSPTPAPTAQPSPTPAATAEPTAEPAAPTDAAVPTPPTTSVTPDGDVTPRGGDVVPLLLLAAVAGLAALTAIRRRATVRL